MYQFTCPGCGTRLEFHKRVTQRRRTCPQCGQQITPEDIDQQERSRHESRAQEEAVRRAAALAWSDQQRGKERSRQRRRLLLFVIGTLVAWPILSLASAAKGLQKGEWLGVVLAPVLWGLVLGGAWATALLFLWFKKRRGE